MRRDDDDDDRYFFTGTVQYSDVLCYGKVFTVRYCTVVNGDALCVVMLKMFVLDIFLARASARASSFKKTRKGREI